MYVVIVGAGKIGTSLAKSLISEGHEITVVDMQSLKCVLLDQILGQVSVEGNATDPRVLDSKVECPILFWRDITFNHSGGSDGLDDASTVIPDV